MQKRQNMNKKIQPDNWQELDDHNFPGENKGKLDLVILRHMGRRVSISLHLFNQAATASQPLLYYSEERYPRIHRIAIYKPEELLLGGSLAFVGFISGKRKPTSPLIVEEIQLVDKKLIAELGDIPGILSYSSLELRNGNWCNLVLLTKLDMRVHIKNTETHAYAAYQLAPRYYDWIRLHHGIIPAGLNSNEMLLQRTRIYNFHRIQQEPVIRELVYTT